MTTTAAIMRRLAPPAFFVLIALLVYGEVFLAPAGTVLSLPGTDIFNQFACWREFGFTELRDGNLALWNPHIFSGAPYFGGFQSALLYPPNWIFMVLPLATAINIGILLHVVLTGLFMYAWARVRGLRQTTAVFAGLLLMLSAPFQLHIAAGHLSNLCAMPWAIGLLATLEMVARSPRPLPLRPLWLGSGCFAMQILAGHPQYVFFTGVSLGIYVLIRAATARHWRLPAALAIMALAGAAISAVQLLTGLAAGQESIRSGGAAYAFAAMFGFPPENLLTLLTPDILGGLAGLPYWGRWYLWEMSLYFSIAGLMLAACAALRPRVNFSLITTAAAIAILAMGRYTPLFDFLYHAIPGFNLFRGMSKFMFFAITMVIMLAATGADSLTDPKNRPPRMIATGAWWLSGLLMTLAAFVFVSSSGGLNSIWGAWMQAAWRSGESYFQLPPYTHPNTVIQSAGLATSVSLLTAAVILAILGAAFRFVRQLPALAILILVIGAVEGLSYARRNVFTMNLDSVLPEPIAAISQATPQNQRVMLPMRHNAGMQTGHMDLWGLDPGVSRRYAEWITHTQEPDRPHVSQYVSFRRLHPRYDMLRLFCGVTPGVPSVQAAPTTPLPHAFLVTDYRVVTDKQRLFDILDAPDFTPQSTILLEAEPVPAPQPHPGAPGRVEISPIDTDTLAIRAELVSNAILVVTDGFSAGWKITAGPNAPQSAYTVMPGNYVLRAVPLAAGTHDIRMVYAPESFRVGMWVSGLSLVAYIGVGLSFLMRAARHAKP